MTYDDLPYKYRVHAAEREWSDGQALEYYNQAKEFRLYLERDLCVGYAASIESDLPDYARAYNIIMGAIRPKRIQHI